MHLRQPRYTYSTYELFTKNKERIRKFQKTGDSRYIYLDELNNACFQHDMAYGDFKDLRRRGAADKVLHDEAFNLAKNPKYHAYRHELASMVHIFLIKRPLTQTGNKN